MSDSEILVQIRRWLQEGGTIQATDTKLPVLVKSPDGKWTGNITVTGAQTGFIIKTMSDNQDELDVCGLCGKPGADKYAHPVHWPGEQVPDGPFVHADCEAEECKRAHAALSSQQRIQFLRTI